MPASELIRIAGVTMFTATGLTAAASAAECECVCTYYYSTRDLALKEQQQNGSVLEELKQTISSDVNMIHIVRSSDMKERSATIRNNHLELRLR
ncbi:hypothetical protein KHA80_22490 [Anaerobacillus sp. HL2]|nr:hypothetical protein KHA80_22490 [Anaerobacillus sp. HL2]